MSEAKKMTSVEVSDKKKISAILVTFLEAAIAGGLPEERAEKIYNDILEPYESMRDDFATAFLSEAKKMTSVEVSDKKKICAILVTFLEAAQAAGLPNERAGRIFNDITERYELMRDDFPKAFLKQIVEITQLPHDPEE